MARFLLIGQIVALFGLYSVSAAGQSSDIVVTDILTGAIPLTGLVVAHLSDDSEGERQWFRNAGVSLVLTSALKLAFNASSLGKRPNGEPYGFPSGHEAFIMSGAAFLGERYGWKWGAPAYIAASYVGYVRVRHHLHYTRDILASAVLSYGVALLTVTPLNATHLAPIIGPGFLGIRLERSF